VRYAYCNNHDKSCCLKCTSNRNNFVVVEGSQGRGTPFAFWGGGRVLRVLQSVEIGQIIIIIIFVCAVCIGYLLPILFFYVI